MKLFIKFVRSVDIKCISSRKASLEEKNKFEKNLVDFGFGGMPALVRRIYSMPQPF